MGLAKTLWTQIQDLVSTGQNVSDNFDVAFSNIDDAIDQVDLNTTDITALKTPLSTKYTDITGSEPTYIKGQEYYAGGTKNIQGDYADVTLQVGRELHLEVINNTGATIPNGTIVQHDGVVAGIIQISLALADSYHNAYILGMTTHDITDGSKGIVTVYGRVNDLDTSAATVGSVLYLSDMVAGGYTETTPDIVTIIGMVLVQDATVGSIEVRPRSNIALQTTLSNLKGQSSPLYSLSAGTPQPITNYTTQLDIVSTSDLLTGEIFIAYAGTYRLNFMFSGTLTDEEIDMTFDLYDTTHATLIEKFIFTSGRGSNPSLVPMSKTFNLPVSILADNTNVVFRVTSATNETIDFNQVSFDMSSIHVR